MKRLVYFSPVPWSSFSQRPHKFVEWFHAKTKGEVLWIEPYPSRFPNFTDLLRKSSGANQDFKQTPYWLTVIKPSSLPIEPLPGSKWLNFLIWNPIFHEVRNFSLKKDCLIAIGKPSVLALAILKKMKGCHSLYDAMDDFPAFYTGFSRWAMNKRETQLVKCVSNIFASSTVLKNRWATSRIDVQLIYNGLDANLLPDINVNKIKGEKKVFGYVGTIAAWFDWAWIIELAKCYPNSLVRLIGPIFSLTPTNLPSNIDLRPACSHHTALQSMLEFDVGLIPFRKNDLTASVDPIKYYEYRAMGLPVISTDFGEMAFRSGERGTYISRGKNDISSLVEQALVYTAEIESVRKFRNDNTWDARFNAANL